MKIDDARKKIAKQLGLVQPFEKWGEILADTNPGNYGTEGVDIWVGYKDIFVDIPKGTFTFKKMKLSFSATLVGTKEGVSKDCKFTVSGEGTFEFAKGSQNIEVTDVNLNEPLEIY